MQDVKSQYAQLSYRRATDPIYFDDFDTGRPLNNKQKISSEKQPLGPIVKASVKDEMASTKVAAKKTESLPPPLPPRKPTTTSIASQNEAQKAKKTALSQANKSRPATEANKGYNGYQDSDQDYGYEDRGNYGGQYQEDDDYYDDGYSTQNNGGYGANYEEDDYEEELDFKKKSVTANKTPAQGKQSQVSS